MFDEPLLLAPPKGVRSLLEVQREKLLYDTGLVALKYAEARGEVVPIAGEHGLERATREIGDAFRQAVGRLHLRAPELTAVATKDGVAGVRGLLKAAERDLLGSFATALAALGERGRAIEAAGGFVVELPEPDADATTSAGRGKHDARPIAPLSIVALIRWLRGEIGRWISGGRSKDEDELQGSGDEQAQELFASLANELAAIVKL